MGIADPEAALAKLREFGDLIEADFDDQAAERHRTSLERLIQMQPLMEAIARAIDPDNVALLLKKSYFHEWPIRDTQVEVVRLIGILKGQADCQQILGPAGPTLAASRLHPWVWSAVASLWMTGTTSQRCIRQGWRCNTRPSRRSVAVTSTVRTCTPKRSRSRSQRARCHASGSCT